MLFRSAALQKEIRRAMPEMQAGGESGNAAARRLIALDPDYALPYLVLATRLAEEGNLEEAESLLWQGVAREPGLFVFYSQLEDVIRRRVPSSVLSKPLAQLALWNLTFAERVSENIAALFADRLGGSMDYSDPKTFEMLATVNEINEKDIFDHPEVRERLLPFKLLADLKRQAPTVVAADLVDEILANAARCEPIWRAALREWAAKPDSVDERAVELIVALLGEISATDVLGDLLEPILFEGALFLHTNWAIWRLGRRFPAEMLTALRQAIPAASATLRCAIAEHLGVLPAGPENTAALLELLNGFPRFAKSGDAPDLLLTVAYFLTQRDEGARAQALIERHRAVLPKRSRQWLQEAVESLDAFEPIILREEIDELDINDICVDRALMDDEDDDVIDDELDDEDIDDELDEGPEGEEEDWIEPVRAPVRPGRNEPCWCGSGKKYKKCHLDSDESESRTASNRATPRSAATERTAPASLPAAPGRLMGDVIHWLGRSRHPGDLREAVRLFFDKSPNKLKDAEMASADFMQWMIYDFRAPSTGRTVLEEYLHREGSRLSADDRAAIESWRAARYGLYEVEGVEEGRGVHLHDLFAGDRFFVHDVSSSRSLVQWDSLLGRVETLEGRHEFSGDGVMVPRTQLPQLLERIQAEAAAAAMTPAEFVRANSHRLHRMVKEISDNWLSGLQVRNVEGDPLEFGSAIYEIKDEPALVQALRAVEEFEETTKPDGDSGVYDFGWLETGVEGPRRSYGRIEIRKGRLKLECDSRKRLERGRRLLEAHAGGLLKHLGDTFESLEAIKRRAVSGPAAKEPKRLPPDVERAVILKYYAEHYAKWPDERLPALDGKTPREAVKTKAGKRAVDDLIRTMENRAERDRKEGRPAFDFQTVRKALGL